MFSAIGQYAIGQTSESDEDTQSGALENMLSAADLEYMRNSTERLMPDSCNLVSITNTPDGEGGVAQARGTVGTSICRLDVVSGREQVTGGAIQPYISYVMSLPYDTTLQADYIIEHSGADYAVKSINLGQSWKAVVRVELERM